ncbi:MAG: nucleotidyl transferase AbiEii/AbiGii toxin family protein [bacterium]|nr:nucleotidyl transferase AbiEii/AbiGii toxin family protein [bacterium]
MITLDQIKQLSKKYKTNESVVAREYVQISVLKELYSTSFSRQIYFKGGTALRLMYGGKRFSENLDFTVTMEEISFVDGIEKVFDNLKSQYPYTIKEKDTLTGKSYLLTANINGLGAPSFVRLDFSMREAVIEPTESILRTEYPIIVQNFISTLSKNEILAEKVRAVMTRYKHRDLYDIWLLLEIGAVLDIGLVNKKLAYYDQVFDKNKLISELAKFEKADFIMDLRPFVPVNERAKLDEFFDFVKVYLLKYLETI